MQRADLSPNPHLPPHLAQVCDLLARGLLRLRSRAADEAVRESEVRLRVVPGQRLHADPSREGDA